VIDLSCSLPKVISELIETASLSILSPDVLITSIISLLILLYFCGLSIFLFITDDIGNSTISSSSTTDVIGLISCSLYSASIISILFLISLGTSGVFIIFIYF